MVRDSSNERFSNKFRQENTTPDNILLPSSLFDNKNYLIFQTHLVCI